MSIAEKRPEEGNPSDSPSFDSPTLITSGSVVKLQMPEGLGYRASKNLCAGRGTRGRVHGRSKASRRRFQQSMGRVDLSQVSGVLLLTLTWSEVPGHDFMARCLDVFIKWLLRRFGDVPIAWAKERGKKTGRWHFHLVVFASDYVNCRAYQAAWDRIAGRFAGNVDVAFKQDAAVVRYLAKYLSKEVGIWDTTVPDAGRGRADRAGAAVDLGTAHISPQEQHTGRTWGWRMYKRLALCPVFRRKITLHSAHQVRRVLSNALFAEIRGRVARWRAWADALKAPSGLSEWPDDIPGWVLTCARNEKVAPWIYCASHHGAARREYARLRRLGSHLARGSFDMRGWSCFVIGDGAPLLEKLATYFEGAS